MQTIKNLANENLPQLNNANKQPLNEKLSVTLCEDDVDEIYRRMTRLFGHKFTSSFGVSDDGTWLMALQGLSKKDLSRGMTVIVKYPNDWPPSVPKFRQMCLAVDSEAIKKRAKKLAIQDCGGGFNFNQFTVMQCRAAIKEMLSKATQQLVDESLIHSQNSTLDAFIQKEKMEVLDKPKMKMLGSYNSRQKSEKNKAINHLEKIKEGLGNEN